jgi:GMP synthase (glutamine-hydrolysing)
MPMQVLVIQNDPMGPPALFGAWLEAQGAVLTIVAADALPTTVDGFDLIVTLGSPHGAYDDLPWIAPQRDLLRAAAEQDRAIIGICFGAQLLADAIGGTAEKMPDGKFHVGWHSNDYAADPVWVGPWVRAHGDHLRVPAGAEVLARDKGTVQAYQYRRAVGVQFHPEAGPEQARKWGAGLARHLAAAGTDAAAWVAQTDALVPQQEAARDALFHEMLRRTVGPRV